jgi:hypothetical protein
MLWAPNGKTVSVALTGRVSDSGTPATALAMVYSVRDEYGAVQPAGDVVVAADGAFSASIPLEARRDGWDRDGRLYLITLTAVDPAGNTSTAVVQAIVPHDRRR